MTVIEALDATKNLLGSIEIPAKYYETIAADIHGAMTNIDVIKEALLNNANREAEEEQNADDRNEQEQEVSG